MITCPQAESLKTTKVGDMLSASVSLERLVCVLSLLNQIRQGKRTRMLETLQMLIHVLLNE